MAWILTIQAASIQATRPPRSSNPFGSPPKVTTVRVGRDEAEAVAANSATAASAVG
jgi:hypothetical protein